MRRQLKYRTSALTDPSPNWSAIAASRSSACAWGVRAPGAWLGIGMSSTLCIFGWLNQLPSPRGLLTYHRDSVINVKRRDLDLVLVRVLGSLGHANHLEHGSGIPVAVFDNPIQAQQQTLAPKLNRHSYRRGCPLYRWAR